MVSVLVRLTHNPALHAVCLLFYDQRQEKLQRKDLLQCRRASVSGVMPIQLGRQEIRERVKESRSERLHHWLINGAARSASAYKSLIEQR